MVMPNDKTTDQVEADVNACLDEYFAAKKAFVDANPAPVAGYFNINNAPPDITVAQARAMHKEAQDAQTAYQVLKNKAGKSFGEYMAVRGYEMLWNAEGDDVIDVRADWGHRHGDHFDMSLGAGGKEI